MITGMKNFDWAKSLPDVVENDNNTFQRSIKATPNEVWNGKKENPIERKIRRACPEKGNKVRIKTKKSVFDKGDVARFSQILIKLLKKQ